MKVGALDRAWREAVFHNLLQPSTMYSFRATALQSFDISVMAGISPMSICEF